MQILLILYSYYTQSPPGPVLWTCFDLYILQLGRQGGGSGPPPWTEPYRTDQDPRPESNTYVCVAFSPDW